MAILLKVPIGDGHDGFIEVEVDPDALGADVELTADSAGHDVAMAPYSLAASFDRVMPAIKTVLTRLRSAERAPDEIEMTLGLSIGGETGLIFAKGTAEATFSVTVTWHRSVGGDAPDTTGPA